MRIRCISTLLPDDLRINEGFRSPVGSPVRLGADYLVLAMNIQRTLWWVTYEHPEQEVPVSAPLPLFEVIDPTVSGWWKLRRNGTDIALQPEEFDDPCFFDDVRADRGNSRERYRSMKERLASEDANRTSRTLPCAPEWERAVELALPSLSTPPGVRGNR